MVAIGSRIFPERSSDWSRAQIFSDTVRSSVPAPAPRLYQMVVLLCLQSYGCSTQQNRSLLNLLESMTGIQPEVLQFVGSSAEFRPVRVRGKPSGKLVNTHVVPIVPQYVSIYEQAVSSEWTLATLDDRKRSNPSSTCIE